MSIIRNENLFCEKCGGEYKITYPIGIDEMSKTMKVFAGIHKDCEQTWTEPKPDQTESIKEKANFWMANGEHGMSSKSMWFFFMGVCDNRISYPYDPDDFSRCYKLLEMVPEWKIRLPELKTLSRQWSNLVDNWDELNRLYEDMKVNHKANGMYELMQKCITNE